MGREILPTLTPRHAGAGILWLQFRYTAVTNGNGWLQYYHASTTNGTTTAAVDYATVAFDAQQSIACNFPTPVPATGATNSTHDNWTADDPSICDVRTINVDAAQDVDGSRSKANVFVRGGTSS